MKPNITRNILLILLAFLGLGAIGGGGALLVTYFLYVFCSCHYFCGIVASSQKLI